MKQTHPSQHETKVQKPGLGTNYHSLLFPQGACLTTTPYQSSPSTHREISRTVPHCIAPRPTIFSRAGSVLVGPSDQ